MHGTNLDDEQDLVLGYMYGCWCQRKANFDGQCCLLSIFLLAHVDGEEAHFDPDFDLTDFDSMMLMLQT
jgi:hypothetical protein